MQRPDKPRTRVRVLFARFIVHPVYSRTTFTGYEIHKENKSTNEEAKNEMYKKNKSILIANSYTIYNNMIPYLYEWFMYLYCVVSCA